MRTKKARPSGEKEKGEPSKVNGGRGKKKHAPADRLARRWPKGEHPWLKSFRETKIRQKGKLPNPSKRSHHRYKVRQCAFGARKLGIEGELEGEEKKSAERKKSTLCDGGKVG